jgi:hypothetical protein
MYAVASIIRAFRACPVRDNRLLGGSPMDKSPGLPPCRIPWQQGKKQGISRIQPLFTKIRLEDMCGSRYLREIIPQAIEQGINSRKKGSNSAFWTGAGNLARNRSARPDAYQAIRLPLYRDVSSSRTRGPRSPRPGLASRLRAAFRLTPSPHRGPTAGYPLSRV